MIRSTQGAEEVLKAHEEQLKEAQAVPATLPELEATKAALKVLCQGLCLPGGRETGAPAEADPTPLVPSRSYGPRRRLSSPCLMP